MPDPIKAATDLNRIANANWLIHELRAALGKPGADNSLA
jgi:hypothetical protein